MRFAWPSEASGWGLGAEEVALLTVEGVLCPFQGALFRPVDALELWAVGEGGGSQIVVFGVTGLDDHVGVSVADREVVQVSPGGETRLVNHSLRSFASIVGWLAGRYPFYVDGATAAEMAGVAAELRAVVAGIDTSAGDPDGYWSTVADSIEMGDWSNEELRDARWLLEK